MKKIFIAIFLLCFFNLYPQSVTQIAVSDTSKLKLKGGGMEGMSVYLLGLSSSNHRGGGWLTLMDSSDTKFPEGGVAFDSKRSGYQWVRKDFMVDMTVQATWFGVRADSSTNDASALQSALNFCAGTNYVLELPCGKIGLLDTSGNVVTFQNVHVNGKGRGTILMARPAASGIAHTFISVVDSVWISNLRLYGPKNHIAGTTPTVHAIYGGVGTYLNLENIWTVSKGDSSGLFTEAVKLDSNSVLIMRNCEMRGWGNSILVAGACTVPQAGRIEAYNCTFGMRTNLSTCHPIYTSTSFLFEGCTWDEIRQGYGIHNYRGTTLLARADFAIVNGCKFICDHYATNKAILYHARNTPLMLSNTVIRGPNVALKGYGEIRATNVTFDSTSITADSSASYNNCYISILEGGSFYVTSGTTSLRDCEVVAEGASQTGIYSLAVASGGSGTQIVKSYNTKFKDFDTAIKIEGGTLYGNENEFENCTNDVITATTKTGHFQARNVTYGDTVATADAFTIDPNYNCYFVSGSTPIRDIYFTGNTSTLKLFDTQLTLQHVTGDTIYFLTTSTLVSGIATEDTVRAGSATLRYNPVLGKWF